jgi:hypothetical protein
MQTFCILGLFYFVGEKFRFGDQGYKMYSIMKNQLYIYGEVKSVKNEREKVEFY